MINRGKRRALSACFHIGPSEIINHWQAAQLSQPVSVAQLNGPTCLWLMIDRLSMKAAQMHSRQTFFCSSAQQMIYTIRMAVCDGVDKCCPALRVCKKAGWVTSGSLDSLFNRAWIGLTQSDICVFDMLPVCQQNTAINAICASPRHQTDNWPHLCFVEHVRHHSVVSYSLAARKFCRNSLKWIT